MSWIITILLIVIIGSAIGLGADDNLLQIIGNMAGSVDGIGVWLNAVSAFTRDTLSTGFRENVSLAFQVLLQCLMSNLLDTIFLGFILEFVNMAVDKLVKGFFGKWFNIAASLAATIIGVLILIFIKQNGQQFYAIAVSGANLAMLAIGIIILYIAKGSIFRTFFFIFNVLFNAVEAGGSIGLLCSLLLIPSMIRSQIPMAAILVWLACLAGLVAVLHFLSVSKKSIEKVVKI